MEVENDCCLFCIITLLTNINGITGLFFFGKISNLKESIRTEIQRCGGTEVRSGLPKVLPFLLQWKP